MIESDNKFSVQKYGLDEPEAKEKLSEKFDMRKLSRLEKDLEKQGISEKPQYLLPRSKDDEESGLKENADPHGQTKQNVEEEKKIEEDIQEHKDHFEDNFEANKNFQKM